MNAIETLYLNAGLITEDGYVKVRDGLWVKSGPYQEQSWDEAFRSILPTKEELKEIYLNIKEVIQTQETCGLSSLRQILEYGYSWVWSSTEYNYSTKCNNSMCCIQKMKDGSLSGNHKSIDNWIIPIRRTP